MSDLTDRARKARSDKQAVDAHLDEQRHQGYLQLATSTVRNRLDAEPQLLIDRWPTTITDYQLDGLYVRYCHDREGRPFTLLRPCLGCGQNGADQVGDFRDLVSLAEQLDRMELLKPDPAARCSVCKNGGDDARAVADWAVKELGGRRD